MHLARTRFRHNLTPPNGSRLDFSHPLMRDIRHAFLFSRYAGAYEKILDAVNPAYYAMRTSATGVQYMQSAYGIGGLGTQCSGAAVGTSNYSGWDTPLNMLCRVAEGAKALTVYVSATNPLDKYNYDATFNNIGQAHVSFSLVDNNTPEIAPWRVSYYDDGGPDFLWEGVIRTGGVNSSLTAASNGRGKQQDFALTYDGATHKVYSDGIKTASASVTGALNVGGGHATTRWAVCSDGVNTSTASRRSFFGVCHYILVWERALTDQEIKWLRYEPYAFMQGLHTIRYSLPKTTQDVPLTASDSINNLVDALPLLSNSAAAHYGVVTGDQLSFLDSIGLVGPPPNYKFLFGENALANLQDSANVATKLQVILSDTINNFADAFSKLSGIPIQAFDSQQFNWADAISTGSISPLSVSKSDTVNNFADSVVVLQGNVFIRLTFGDTINLLSDAIRIYSTIRVLTDDNLTMSDSLMTRMNNLMKIGEQLAQLQEGLVLSKTAKPQFADSVNNLADSVTVALTVNLVLHKSDALSLSDSVSVELSGSYNPTTTIDRIRRYLGDLQSS